MKIPKAITIGTKEYVEIITKLHLYIARYGCAWVHHYLSFIPLRYAKVKNRNAGAYIINKVCDVYKVTNFDLFHKNGRKELTEARQVLCALIYKHLGISQAEIAGYFEKSKHFANRAIAAVNQSLKDNHPFDKLLLERYRKLDSMISAYMEFSPVSEEEQTSNKS